MKSPEFNEAYERTMARLNTPIEPPEAIPPATTLRHCYETAYLPARLATRDEHTRRQYDLNLRRFQEFLGREPLLSDLTDATVNSAIAWLTSNGGKTGRTAGGLGAGSIDKFRDNMCSVWRYLNQVRIVDTVPSVPAVTVPLRAPIAWTRDQLTLLWEGLARIPGEIDGVPANLWWLSLHAVIFDTGERIGAVMQTQWADIDLSAGYIIVRAENRKGGRADKTTKLHPQTIAFLRRALAPRRELVWPWPRTYTYLWVAYKHILRALGLPCEGRDRSFHAMRKSVASHAKAAGLNPSDILGHSDPKMIERYIDERIAPPPMACDHLFRPSTFGKPEEPDQNPSIRIFRDEPKEGLNDAS